MTLLFWGGLALAVAFALGTFVIIRIERKAEQRFWDQRVEGHERYLRERHQNNGDRK